MKNFDLLTLGTTKNHVNFFPTSSVLLICLTEDENYVVKRGKIVNTNRNYKNKYGSLFQVRFFLNRQISIEVKDFSGVQS